MNKIYKKLAKCSFLGAALLLGATACSDDHFDVKDLSGVAGSNATIWESIVANDSVFSQSRSILERTRVMVDDKDKRTTLTFAQWLDQPMEVTVWLPKNGSFEQDYNHYISLLDRADSLRSHDSLAQALRVEYQVVSQFVRNHMALFNNDGSNLDDGKVRMLNSKVCTFDVTNHKFNGVNYDPAKTTHNRNGVLYMLTDGASPYAYNIYDFMSSKNDFSKVFSVISDPSVDKNVFWPEGSTEGAMNENGEIVYVDSAYINTNELLSRANALIKSEDSLYVAFIPTNDAWEATMEAVKPMFNYGNTYHYEWDEDHFLHVGNANGLHFNVDSLREVSARSQIIESMFFNVTDFHLGDKPSEAEILNHLRTADSLISTNGIVFYNSNKGGENPMFAGLEPIKASNGYVFAPENCRIVPEYSFIRRTETRPSAMIAKVYGHQENITLTVDNWQKDSVYGEVQDDSYTYFKKTGSNLKVRLRLSNLASGHYKISAQMLPNRININNVSYEKDGVTPIKEKPDFDAYIYLDDSFSKKVATKKHLTVNQDSVQNVVLFDDFELNKSYRKLPAGYETFAILELQISISQARKGKCDALSIGKIVIEPVRK